MANGLEMDLSEFATLGLNDCREDLLSALAKPPLSDPRLEGTTLRVVYPDEYEMSDAAVLVLTRLGEIIKNVNQHRILCDDILGELWWEEDECCWYAEIDLGDDQFQLKIHSQNQESRQELERARRFVANIDYELQRLRDETGRWLFSEYDTTWDDQIAESPEWYARQLGISHVTFSRDGGLEAWFDIGELFADHAVSIDVDIQGNVQSVNLEG